MNTDKIKTMAADSDNPDFVTRIGKTTYNSLLTLDETNVIDDAPDGSNLTEK